MKTTRLNASLRRETILKAVAPLFARHGLNGVTTRQLAAAAGVSEALLYRHFANKLSLFKAVSAANLRQANLATVIPAELPASTRRLVVTVHRLTEFLTSQDNELATRQLVHSLLDDGQLAHTHFVNFSAELFPALQNDLRAAHLAGDIESGHDYQTETWLLHHLLLGLQLSSLPQRTSPAYRCARFELLQRTVHFLLRGLGLHANAIAREYRPELL